MIRLALIGCGSELEAYARVLPRVRGAQLTAVVDPDATRLAQGARLLKSTVGVESLDRLLLSHSSSFDAVLIHTPVALRAPLALQAAAARKHLLIDVPIASSIEEADRVLSVCRTTGVRLMPAAVERFLPSVKVLQSTLASGKLGEPGLLRIHRWEPRRSTSSVAESSSGLFERLLAREIDLAEWMFGERPTHIAAVGPRSAGGALDELDYVQAHLGFSKGGMALLDCAETLPAGEGYTSRSLIGSTGAGYADDHHNMQLIYRGGAPSAVRTTEGDSALQAMLQEFVEAIAAGRDPSVTGAEGRETVLQLDAVSRAMNADRAVALSGGRYDVA